MSPQPSVIIAGRSKDTKNYEKALERLGVFHRTVLDPETACQATHLLLPGGGDITPAFFGQKDRGSRNIDEGPDGRISADGRDCKGNSAECQDSDYG